MPGTIQVVRARAIAGQVVRVTFDQEPKHHSAAGIDDGLNPSNYDFAITVGHGTAPLAVGVDPAVVVGPVAGVAGPIAILTATNASPIVIGTLTPHGRQTGDSVTVTGCLVNTHANGTHTVVVVDSLHLQLVGTTGNGAYGGGGILQTSERALDVHVDRQLIIGLSYQVGARNLVGAAGLPLGVQNTAPFVGTVPLSKQPSQIVRASQIDFDNPNERGTWFVDDSGDLRPTGGQASLKKRILRRLMTQQNAFRFLPGYGLPLRLKRPMTDPEVGAVKRSAQQQVASEPEVASVLVSTTLTPALGLFVLQVLATTRVGAVVEAGIQLNQTTGTLTIL